MGVMKRFKCIHCGRIITVSSPPLKGRCHKNNGKGHVWRVCW